MTITQMTMRSILDAMGGEATDAEAQAMAEILHERGIHRLEDISDQDFFRLIPEAIDRGKK